VKEGENQAHDKVELDYRVSEQVIVLEEGSQ
jgi:hypothetical protein